MNQNTTISVAAEHLTEWTELSGVSEAIATLNIESLSAEELNARIKPKNPIQTGGWWCRGVNWRNGQPMGLFYGQGKPDKEHIIDPDKGKKAKYMTASGMEPDAVFLAMPDKDYWAKVYADESIVRVWAEGAKKGGSGLTLGIATIVLTGCGIGAKVVSSRQRSSVGRSRGQNTLLPLIAITGISHRAVKPSSNSPSFWLPKGVKC